MDLMFSKNILSFQAERSLRKSFVQVAQINVLLTRIKMNIFNSCKELFFFGTSFNTVLSYNHRVEWFGRKRIERKLSSFLNGIATVRS